MLDDRNGTDVHEMGQHKGALAQAARQARKAGWSYVDAFADRRKSHAIAWVGICGEGATTEHAARDA